MTSAIVVGGARAGPPMQAAHDRSPRASYLRAQKLPAVLRADRLFIADSPRKVVYRTAPAHWGVVKPCECHLDGSLRALRDEVIGSIGREFRSPAVNGPGGWSFFPFPPQSAGRTPARPRAVQGILYTGIPGAAVPAAPRQSRIRTRHSNVGGLRHGGDLGAKKPGTCLPASRNAPGSF